MLGQLWAFMLLIFFLCYYYGLLGEVISPAKVTGTEAAEAARSPMFVQRLWTVREVLPHRSCRPVAIQL